MVGPNTAQTGSMPPMGAGSGGAAGVGPETIPDIRRPDFQLLMQDIAQARRDVFEERRNADKRVNEERERSRWEIERLRAEIGEKVKKADRENDALITALGRLREENDDLREENAILKIGRSNGHVEPKSQAEPEPAKGPLQPLMGTGPFLKKHDVSMVPPPGPALGKAQSIDPTKLG